MKNIIDTFDESCIFVGTSRKVDGFLPDSTTSQLGNTRTITIT